MSAEEHEPSPIKQRIAIDRVTAATPEIAALLDELNAALAGPYTADQRHALPIEQLFQPGILFFVARLNGVAVACGGVAFLDGYAEVKRMYSKASVRRQGVGRALLRSIEAEARDAGTPLLRLETGRYQEDALRFYEAAGFRRRGPFGPYADMPPHAIETSLFYEKPLTSGDEAKRRGVEENIPPPITGDRATRR